MWSGDSSTTPDELARAVEETGLDVVCITDHSTVKGALVLSARLACRVIVGQEQRTPEGELIGLFLSEPVPPGCRSVRDAARVIKDQGGLVSVPHPLEPRRHSLDETTIVRLAEEGTVDLLEVRNAKSSSEETWRQVEALCDRLGLTQIAGSDAHVPEALGAAYVEIEAFDTAEEFVTALRGGTVAGHLFDPPRSFEVRVVPSLKTLG